MSSHRFRAMSSMNFTLSYLACVKTNKVKDTYNRKSKMKYYEEKKS